MKTTKHGLLSLAAVLTVAFALNGTSGTAMAVTHNDDTHDHTTTTEETKTSRSEQTKVDARAKTEAAIAERREAAGEKLSAAKLKACENRKANINNRMTRISERATKHLEVFNAISERAQTFYTEKGKTLTNYDQLVANVTAKKAAAESVIASMTTATTEFTCDGVNPKQTVEEFRTGHKSAITALKEYRTAIKDLIVGIKSVNADRTTKTNSTEDAR